MQSASVDRCYSAVGGIAGSWSARVCSLVPPSAKRVDRRFELQEMLIRGRLAFVGIDELTSSLDEPGDSLVAHRILLGHDTSLRSEGFTGSGTRFSAD